MSAQDLNQNFKLENVFNVKDRGKKTKSWIIYQNAFSCVVLIYEQWLLSPAVGLELA